MTLLKWKSGHRGQYSLSRVSVRPDAAEAADAVTCALATHGADHAQVVLPLVLAW